MSYIFSVKWISLYDDYTHHTTGVLMQSYPFLSSSGLTGRIFNLPFVNLCQSCRVFHSSRMNVNAKFTMVDQRECVLNGEVLRESQKSLSFYVRDGKKNKKKSGSM